MELIDIIEKPRKERDELNSIITLLQEIQEVHRTDNAPPGDAAWEEIHGASGTSASRGANASVLGGAESGAHAVKLIVKGTLIGSLVGLARRSRSASSVARKCDDRDWTQTPGRPSMRQSRPARVWAEPEE